MSEATEAEAVSDVAAGRSVGPVVGTDALADRLDAAIATLEEASNFAKAGPAVRVVDVAHRLMVQPGGVALVAERIGQVDAAGVFAGTDWENPETLQARLAAGTLEHGEPALATLEMLSELRLLAVARREIFHPAIASESAQHFLSQVLALELNHLLGAASEADRAAGNHGVALRHHLEFIAEGIGYGHVLDSLIDEIDRILAQRPIMVDHAKQMIARIAAYLADPALPSTSSALGLNRLVSALFGPTATCRDDPGVDVYAERLETLDDSAMRQEAREFALAMHSTGLVSPYQPIFLHHVNDEREDLVGQTLGLSRTGVEALSCYGPLVSRLIDVAITADTPQTVYSLAQMIEGAVLFDPAVSPSLWGMIDLACSPTATQTLAAANNRQPASTVLLAGVIDVLGQPLGVGQGNNPTCQAARAISMWALTAPDYLLRMVERAARDNEIRLFFEGEAISSAEVPTGSFAAPLVDVDPVSMVLVPHLDRIYMEMGRRVAQRDGDPHTWINREMHGWWVGRETELAVDVPTGKLDGYDLFVRRFYALYHPLYNRDRPVVHPQPAGAAITDSFGRFIGWHAISILRVGLDPSDEVRVFFYNPNNDGGQDWGNDVVVSTEGRGERYGESSLPIAEFTSRLYLFHFDPSDLGDVDAVPPQDVAEVEALARATWAADR